MLIMPRTGRPKSPDSKDERIVVRVTGKEFLKIKEYVEKNNITIAELVRGRIQDILSE